MTLISCKMCGGDIELSEDMTHGTCQYCGSTMTLPKINDEQRASAFNRGNHFRRIGEFDKAVSVYERIVNENNADAEAHWCLALSRFGIEYVKDPVSGEYKPTCHRASYDSFLEDVDYQAALEYSDGVTRRQYEEDARKIMEVQKGLLAISQKEEEFDIFICYKESDDNGNRTKDSVLAQDIYYQLTEQGYRVFFSRITLEDKAGMEYEPYIFAALHSAHVMIVVGTKPEYLNAVWVKNEWSRYLAFMKQDKNKLILPCYRDMDPYDMPEQLSILQAYDMGKIGFVQDLLHGIGKVLRKEESKKITEKVVVTQSEMLGNQSALIKRGNMALEDREFDRADDFFEQALNQDAECGEAYLGKKLAQEKCSNLDEFVKVCTEISKEEWEKFLKRDVANAFDKDLVDCINELKRKYSASRVLSDNDIVEKVQAVYDSSIWLTLTFWVNREEIIKSDKLIIRAVQYGETELQEMLRERILSVLEKKIQKETTRKSEHLVWIKEQIHEEAKKRIELGEKREEMKQLDRNLQVAINSGNFDILREYLSYYQKLAVYFRSASENLYFTYCEKKIEACQYAPKLSLQCEESIEEYKNLQGKKRVAKIEEKEWKNLQDKFRTYLEKKEYLSKRNIDLCGMYDEYCGQELQEIKEKYLNECSLNERVSKIKKIGLPLVGIVIVIILLCIAMS